MVVNIDENENGTLENDSEDVKILYGMRINASHIINVNTLINKNPYWSWNIELTPDPYCRSIDAIFGTNRWNRSVRLMFDVGSNTKLAILFNLSLLPNSSFCIWWRSKCLNESGQSSLTRI